MLRRLESFRSGVASIAAAVGETRELARQVSIDVADLREELANLSEQQASIAESLQRHGVAIAALEAAALERGVSTDRALRDLLVGLRRVHANEAWNRRHLREARRSAEYEAAYSEQAPLISVLIPTYDRLETLRSRTIPSILAQDYENVEIVIVGDHASYGHAEVVEGFERAAIQYLNLETRGPYPEQRERRWLVAGTPPFNAAMHLARGSWLAPFADDDAMRPAHLRTLLAAARERRLELVYGRFAMHEADGTSNTLGEFPPRMGAIALQAALVHAQMSFFELELADADFGLPNDWARVERMLRAGVRVGMIDDVLVDYYPSGRAADDSDGP